MHAKSLGVEARELHFDSLKIILKTQVSIDAVHG